MLDGADGVRGQAQPDELAERVAEQRGVLQVGQEAPPGLVVGMADIVASLHALAGDGAAPCHDRPLP